MQDHFFVYLEQLFYSIPGGSSGLSIYQLYKIYFPPLYKKLEKDLTQWSEYGLSWLRRINAVKMTPLPRVLYLFRLLPITIVKSQLNTVDSNF